MNKRLGRKATLFIGLVLGLATSGSSGSWAAPDCSDPATLKSSEDIRFCAQRLSSDKARTGADWDDCKYADQEATKIAACGRLIDSKSTSRDERVLAYILRANVRRHGDMDGAISDLDRAIALDPNSEDAYLQRGADFVADSPRKNLSKAIEDFSKVIALNPNSSSGYGSRSLAYEKKGDLDRAVDDASKVIAIELRAEKGMNYEYSLHNSYMRRAALHEEKGDLDRAILDYSRALEYKSDDRASAYGDRGRVFGHKGDFKQAIDDTSKAIELTSDDVFVFVYARLFGQRGRFLLLSGNPAKALDDFTQAYQHDPDEPAYLLWGELARRRGNLPSRLSQQAKNLDMAKWPSPIIRSYLNRLTIEQVVAAASDPDPEVKQQRLCQSYFFMGELALVGGQAPEALRLLRTAVDACPGSSPEKYAAMLELKTIK